MADNVLSSTFQQIQQQATANSAPSAGIGTGWIIGAGIFVGIAIIAVVGAFVWWYFWDRKQWNIITRVHYENPTIDGISMGYAVPTKRIRFKDGRVVYMYKTHIQGYNISPELLTWTRPREHDVIVTEDKKLFCLIGISSIDAQRKKLNVDVSYPDIEMDRQDLQQFVDSKKFDDPNERFKIIAKIALWIFVIVGVIVVVVLGGKTYLEGKSIDNARSLQNLETAKYNAETMKQVNTFILILNKVMPESFKAIDGKNLLLDLNITGVTK